MIYLILFPIYLFMGAYVYNSLDFTTTYKVVKIIYVLLAPILFFILLGLHISQLIINNLEKPI